MATITVKAAYPTIPGEIRWYPMAVSQSFKRGEFVYLNESGQITVCASDPTVIAGMAMADAADCAGGSTVTTTNIACPITLAKRGQQFTVHANTATANTMCGDQFGLVVASNLHQVDISDVTNKRFIVDAIAPEDTVTDTYGRLIVEVVGTRSQLDQSTS